MPTAGICLIVMLATIAIVAGRGWRLRLALVLCGPVMAMTAVRAQAPEIFHGSTLRTAFGAGVLVSATKRGNGDEILRVRANSNSIQAFLSQPGGLPQNGNRPYHFELQIGPPAIKRDTCSIFPGSELEFQACFSSSQQQRLGAWDVMTLGDVDSEIMQLGFRLRSEPAAYAHCGYVKSHKSMTSCFVYFQQAHLWHELVTAPRVLENIDMFRCAALELRNAVWPDAPPNSDLCR